MSNLDICMSMIFGGKTWEQNWPHLLGFYDNHTRKPGWRQFSFVLKINGCNYVKYGIKILCIWYY